MNINRDNYEHWLLLYIDRELSAADKEAFEAFAAANPDVQDELELYNQTILAPDETICFSGIANLLQPEVWDENQISPLQEALLQKLDGSLEHEQLHALDRQIDTDPLLQKEWALLRQVKLEAEMPAEMPDKTALLRRQNSRIVPLKWMVRVTAAAAVLVSGWLLLPNLVGHKQPATATASVTPAVKQNEPANNRSISNNPSGEFSAFDSAANNQGPVTMTTAKKLQTGNSIDNNLQKKAKDILAEAIATTTNGAAVMGNTNPANQTNVQHDNPETALTTTAQVALRNEVVIPAETAGLTEKAVETIQSQQLQPQVRQPEAEETNPVALAATWEEPDNDMINIAGARINKQKLRGVYRNITRPLARVFEKKPETGTLAAK